MVSIRLLSFLLFILVHLVESRAHRQDMETILGEDGRYDLRPAKKALSKTMEAFDDAPTVAKARNSRFEARKMKLRWGLDKKDVTVEGRKISENDSITKHNHKWPTGFTAFAADYHVPKSHPPKHN